MTATAPRLRDYPGLERVAADLAALIARERSTSVVRRLALRIAKEGNARVTADGHPDFRDRDDIAAALYRGVRRRVAYSYDPPGTELVQKPRTTLDVGIGDCEDMVVLGGALLSATGIPVRVVLVSYAPDRLYSHTYLEYEGARGWTAWDATLEHAGAAAGQRAIGLDGKDVKETRRRVVALDEVTRYGLSGVPRRLPKLKTMGLQIIDRRGGRRTVTLAGEAPSRTTSLSSGADGGETTVTTGGNQSATADSVSTPGLSVAQKSQLARRLALEALAAGRTSYSVDGVRYSLPSKAINSQTGSDVLRRVIEGSATMLSWDGWDWTWRDGRLWGNGTANGPAHKATAPTSRPIPPRQTDPPASDTDTTGGSQTGGSSGGTTQTPEIPFMDQEWFGMPAPAVLAAGALGGFLLLKK